MKKFGSVMGVTASSVLLAGDAGLKFMQLCKNPLDKRLFEEFHEELLYMLKISPKIEDKLIDKGLLKANNQALNIKQNLSVGYIVYMSKKNGIDLSYNLNLVEDAEDPFGDMGEDDFEDPFGDMGGDNFEDPFGEQSEEVKDIGAPTYENLLYIANTDLMALDIQQLHNNLVMGILEELDCVCKEESYNVLNTRCKNRDIPIIDNPIIQSFIRKALTAGDSASILAKLLVKANEDKISIFNLTMNELDLLISEMKENNLVHNEEKDIVDYEFSEKVMKAGDFLAKSILLKLQDKSLQQSLHSLCTLRKIESRQNITIMGIQPNTMYLTLKGRNFTNFCEKIQNMLRGTMRTSDRREELKKIIDCLNTLTVYVNEFVYKESDGKEYSQFFKDMMIHFRMIKDSNSGELERVEREYCNLFRFLNNQAKIPDVNYFEKVSKDFSVQKEELNKYALTIYSTYQFLNLSSAFSLDAINDKLSLASLDYLEPEEFFELEEYLKEEYRIIPLSLDFYVRKKIMATRSSHDVSDYSQYGAVKDNLELIKEDISSKLYLLDNPGTIIFN